MTTGLVRLAGDGSRGVGLGLVLEWLPLGQDGRKGVQLLMMGGARLEYWDEDAQRIMAWLKENSDIPVVAPG